MKTLNTLTSSNKANFEKKTLHAWNTQFGIEVGSRKEWINDNYSYPGCVKFISKHVDMFAGTQQERQLYIRDTIIDKLAELGVAKNPNSGVSFLITDKTIEL
jgi:hypothetical protein